MSLFTDDSIMHDGWILGPNDELLFWVPPVLQKGISWPRTRLVIGAVSTKLDFKHFVHGEKWPYTHYGG